MRRPTSLSTMLLFGLACAPPPSSPPNGNAVEPLKKLAPGEASPWAVAVDGDSVYWLAGNALRRVHRDGGDVATLAAVQDPFAFTVAAGVAYVSEAGRNRVIRVAADGATDVVVNGTSPRSLVVANGFLYWIDDGPYETDGVIRRIALGASHVETLAEGLAYPASLIVANGSLYWTSNGFSQSGGPGGVVSLGGGVWRMPVDGGEVARVSSSGIPLSVVVRNGKAYFPAEGGIIAANVDGSGQQALPGGSSEVYYLTADDEALYWATGYSNARVQRLPLDGGEALTLVADLASVHGLAVDDAFAYVAEKDAILRVAKDGSANRPTGPITGPCPEPLPGDLTGTPRGDDNMELLALTLVPNELTVDQATYDRVARDVATIRAAYPQVAHIRFRTLFDGRHLELETTSVTAQSITAGDYHAWDCLNDHYQLLSLSHESGYGEWFFIELKGIYNTPRIAELYAQLPGVLRAYPSGGEVLGDGPTICLGRSGEQFHYVFDDRGGDCPLGCTSTVAHHFFTTTSGDVVEDGTWISEVGDAPDWYPAWCTR